MSNAINYENLVFFDLETSGLDFENHEIIQIAALDAKTGDTFMEYLEFDIDKADKEALEHNCFDESIWDEFAIPPIDALRKFSRFLSNHTHLKRVSKKGNDYQVAALAGYNVLSFDKHFLLKAFKEYNIFIPADFRMYDVFPLAMWGLPGLERYDLTSIVQHLKLPLRGAHDALEDVLMTADVCKHLLNKGAKFKSVDWGK